MDIHPVKRTKRGNRFCGPAIISSLAGIDTDAAARLIRSVNPHKTAIKGTHAHEILPALAKCGIRAKRSWEYIKSQRPTLSGWLEENSERTGRVFLVAAGNHWQLISGRRYVCGRTIEIVSIRDEKVKRRARVESVYELVAVNGITVPSEAAAPKKAEAAQRRKAKKLAEEFEIQLETLSKDREGFTIGVWPPDNLYANEDDDPFGGDHYRTNWFDILEMVERYAGDAKAKSTVKTEV